MYILHVRSRVVGQPSSRTDYVVLGDNAGPAKIAAIKKHGIKTLTEDEFLHLIATRKGPSGGNLDDKTKKKMEKEQEVIRTAAKEMEKREKKAAKESAGASGRFVAVLRSRRLCSTFHLPSSSVDLSSQLWTTRYAPQNLKEICGNKTAVEKLEQWLKDWFATFHIETAK